MRNKPWPMPRTWANTLGIQPAVDWPERWRVLLGVFVSIFLTALICRGLGSSPLPLSWLVAPLGASAVLVFAVPASPLAQPWVVVGGNTISALLGVACASYIADPALAAASAVALAISLMFALRCMHPPSGAVALLAVLTHTTQPVFALFPVLTNSVLLVLCGVLYNRLTGRDYPHVARASTGATRFSKVDLDEALMHFHQSLGLNRDDLADLLHHAESAAYQRNLAQLSCANVMTPQPVSVEFGTPLDEAWALMRKHSVKALPVVDRARRIVGIVTVSDFLRQVNQDVSDGLGMRLLAFVRRSGASHSDKPEVVGQIMTRQVRVASAQRYVIELVPLFSQGGHHHIPVIDAEQRLVGILTQTDFVKALHRAVQPVALG